MTTELNEIPGSDEKDWPILLLNIVKQGIDDYIKLQHPKKRNLVYLEEHFRNAADMFFDPEFRFQNIKNEDNDHMSIKDMLSEMLNEDNIDLSMLHTYLINKAKEYWAEKNIKTVEIPQALAIEGHVYSLSHHEKTFYNKPHRIDYNNKIIYINMKSPTLEQDFIVAMVECLCYHEELKVSAKNIKLLGAAFYRLLKVNNSFKPIRK